MRIEIYILQFAYWCTFLTMTNVDRDDMSVGEQQISQLYKLQLRYRSSNG